MDSININDKYNEDITYIQVNFDAFKMPDSTALINRYSLNDIINYSKLEDNIQIIHINIDMIKKMAYNEDEKELYNCLKVFKVGSQEELDELAKESSYVKEVKDNMKEFFEKNPVGVYYEEDEKRRWGNTLKEAGRREGEAIGLEKGKEAGIKETQEATATEMLKKGYKDEDIVDITKLPLKKINALKLLL